MTSVPSAASSSASTAPPLLRHPPFTLFWLSRVAAMAALQMQTVAVGWQAYDLTGSALDLGLIGLAQFIPAVLLALVVGHVADRYDRRLVLAVSRAVQAIAFAALVLGGPGGWFGFHGMLGIVAVLGAARAFDHATSNALLPALVPRAVFSRALALSASATQSATIIGPALGGLLYGFGPDIVYVTCAVMAAAAAALVARITIERTAATREKPSLTSLFAGLRFIRANPAVLGAISLDLFAVLLGGATALLPIFARDILRTGPWGLGLLRAGPALGALLLSAILSYCPLRRRAGAIMFAAVAVFGAATIVFALSTTFPLSLAALVVIGASDVVSVVIRSSLVQIQTPDAMRGRVSAVNSLFVGTSNQLGEFESGATAALFGAVPAVVIGGVGTILIVLIWMRLFPELRRTQHLDAL